MWRWLWLSLWAFTAAHGATFVLTVGVEQYDDPGVTPLRYAVADAQAVAAVFRGAGATHEQVSCLTSDTTEPARRATRINVVTALQRIRDLARPGDQVVCFYAGHGLEHEGRQYLLTADTRRDLLADTALPMSLVNRALTGLQASAVVFLIDACRNAPDAARGEADVTLSEGLARGLRPQVLARPEAPKPELTATLLSCSTGQRAWEDPERGHGAFTTVLLAGLSGQAAGPDGQVWLSGLNGYLEREMKLWCARTGRDQTPHLDNPSGGDVVLLKPPPEPLVTLTARNTPLADVVAEVADQVGAQVVFGAGVDPTAKVTGRLEQQPLSTALRVLLLAHQLTVRIEGEVYIIERPGTPDEPPAQPAPGVAQADPGEVRVLDTAIINHTNGARPPAVGDPWWAVWIHYEVVRQHPGPLEVRLRLGGQSTTWADAPGATGRHAGYLPFDTGLDGPIRYAAEVTGSRAEDGQLQGDLRREGVFERCRRPPRSTSTTPGRSRYIRADTWSSGVRLARWIGSSTCSANRWTPAPSAMSRATRRPAAAVSCRRR